MEKYKVQSLTIVFVYVIIGIAFFYINGFKFNVNEFKLTGRAIGISNKLTLVNLVVSALILVALGLLIIYNKRKTHRKK